MEVVFFASTSRLFLFDLMRIFSRRGSFFYPPTRVAVELPHPPQRARGGVSVPQFVPFFRRRGVVGFRFLFFPPGPHLFLCVTAPSVIYEDEFVFLFHYAVEPRPCLIMDDVVNFIPN